MQPHLFVLLLLLASIPGSTLFQISGGLRSSFESSFPLFADESSRIPHTTSTGSRTNHKVRGLLEYILQSLNQEWDVSEWSRLRNYLYRTQDKLTIDQTRGIISFLIGKFDKETAATILKQSPRILRKNAQTSLEPTYCFLEELYGKELLAIAIERNPNLLLTRGAGYNSGSLDLVGNYLMKEIKLSNTQVTVLKKKYPKIFQVPVSKLRSNVNLLQQRMASLPPTDRLKNCAKLLTTHPQIFDLAVSSLENRLDFLRESCGLEAHHVIRNAGALLGLSVRDNIEPKVKLLSQYVQSRSNTTLPLTSHPQVLGLSEENLRSKLDLFDSIDGRYSTNTSKTVQDESLVGRVLTRSASVFSLNLNDNLLPKLQFLGRIWGVDGIKSGIRDDEIDKHSKPSLAQQLRQYPSILSLSLEGNIKPTVEFYNRTGYIQLNSTWHLVEFSHVLRGRDISVSLSNRLLPRWHYVRTHVLGTDSDAAVRKVLPFHVLVSASDPDFCDLLCLNATAYSIFKRESVPRLRFSLQFDTWLKTGRPIDVN